MRDVDAWIGRFRTCWEERLTALDGVLEELERQSRKPQRKKER